MSAADFDVIILGSGPAGLTAGVYTSRANLKVLIAHGPLPGGQLMTTTEVENFPGFSQGIMGPELMDEMRKQTERFGAVVEQKVAAKVEMDKPPFKVHFDGHTQTCRALIIATGASARYLGIDREAELMGHGLSTCATCDGAFFRDQEIVVVGGGDSACEEALFLTKFGKRVRVIHRRGELRASKIMASRVLSHPKIEMVWFHTLSKLHGDKKGGITGATLTHTETGENTEITCNAIFYAIGHTPNTQLFTGKLDHDANGYLITKPQSTATKIPGVFACGDVQDHVFRQAVTAAGTGCMAAIEAERYLAGH